MICVEKTPTRETKNNSAWKLGARFTFKRTQDDLDTGDRFPEVDKVLGDISRKDKLLCA